MRLKLRVGTNLAYSLGFLRVLGPPAFLLFLSNQLSWMQMVKSNFFFKKKGKIASKKKHPMGGGEFGSFSHM